MTLAATRCPSCAAAVAPQDVRCSHCGSQLATVACPNCFALVATTAGHCGQCGSRVALEPEGPSGPCPECQQALRRTAHGPTGLDQCLKCGGVWMARVSFEQVTQDHELRAAMVGYLPAAEPSRAVEAIRYRPCPACNRLMNRLNYGRISGVIVDVCKEDGVWFDADELRRVVDFIQAGGLEKARDRQIQALEDAKKVERLGAALAAEPSDSDWRRRPSTSGLVVGDLVAELLTWWAD